MTDSQKCPIILFANDEQKHRDNFKTFITLLSAAMGYDATKIMQYVKCVETAQETQKVLVDKTSNIKFVAVDNNFGFENEQGVALLKAAQQSHPEAKLFWASRQRPGSMDYDALQQSKIQYENATIFGGMVIDGIIPLIPAMSQNPPPDPSPIPKTVLAALRAAFAEIEAFESQTPALKMARRIEPINPIDQGTRPPNTPDGGIA